MKRVYIATLNRGKLRDFSAAAHGVAEILPLPNFSSLSPVEEDGATFEENARKKAAYYSSLVRGEVVVADDSGLEVEALGGAPGVHSARYAAPDKLGNATDSANNERLLRELEGVPDQERGARFVCVIAVARDGEVLATFRGEAKGMILHAARGTGGFGYDPLFLFPDLGKTFAELTPEEKARVSHRGQAFSEFTEWINDEEAAARHGH
jgi:XTP/dITP diphosphohydrolase